MDPIPSTSKRTKFENASSPLSNPDNGTKFETASHSNSNVMNNQVIELYETLTSMFPATSPEFLREQAEELAGNSAGIERFISDHLDRDSEPPENWKSKETDSQVSQNLQKRLSFHEKKLICIFKKFYFFK